MINEILEHTAVVHFEKCVSGYFNGERRQFEFTPEKCEFKGRQCVKWGSWTANCWFVVSMGKSVKTHFAAVRRKLRGDPPRKITFEKKE